MRQGSESLGKPVFAYDTGQTVATTRDIIFDHKSNRVLGFLVAEAGWFRAARILPLSAIKAIGPNAIVVPSKSAIVSARTHDRARAVLREDNVLKGTKIFTTDGRHLGTMADLFFDDATGLVEGYEVSGGLLADAYSGRSFVPALQALTIGEDVAFVVPETAELMEEQVGGVLGALQGAGDRLQEAGQYTSEKLQAAGQYTSERWQTAIAAAQQDWQTMTQEASAQYALARRQAEVSITNAVVSPEEQRSYALDKTTLEPVLDNDDRQLFPAGLTISAVEVQRAADLGVLDRLYRATGGDLGEEARDRLQAATQAAKHQFHAATQSAQARLQAAQDRAGQDLQALQDNAAASMTSAVVDSDQQRAYALGKTLNRNLYTAEGDLLAAEGTVVTTDILALADAAGVLGELYRATGGDLGADLTRQALGLLATPAAEQALGRRAETTVRTPAGVVIVAAGQIVTETVLERAKTHRQEHALLEATGLNLDRAYRLGASRGLAQTGDRLKRGSAIAGQQLQTGASQLQAEALTLWAVLQRQAQQLIIQTQQFIENRRIQRALGRPVTRVILDQQDQVILNVGELITHQAIDRARAAGCLDILLGSVYDYSPEVLTQSDLRAPARGKAALPQSN